MKGAVEHEVEPGAAVHEIRKTLDAKEVAEREAAQVQAAIASRASPSRRRCHPVRGRDAV